MPGTLIRTTVKATFSHYQRRWLGANHEWKAGTQIEQGDHRSFSIIPTGVRFVDNNGQPFQSVSADPSVNGAQFISTALFLTDTVSFGERLTVNAGVRFDHNRAMSQDLAAVDVNGRDTGATIRGLGTLFTWNLVSPRLGVAAKLSSNGRTVLRSSYGRFHQGILTAEISGVHPGNTPVTTRMFDPATGGYTTLVSVVDPAQVRVDPNTRSPLTDEYSIDVVRKLGRRPSATAADIGKNGRDYSGWTDVGCQYRTETGTLADGRTIPVFVLSNSRDARRFLVTNPPGYSLKYNGMVLAAEKRMFSGWQALASYTFSKVTGLQASSGTTPGSAQVSTIALSPNGTFGRDPNDLTNARGRWPNDRPHMFRIMGTVEVPWTGLMIATNF